MVKHIREAFKARVDDAGWMDDATRKAARDKADVMTEFIGFPDWYSNSTALRNYYEGVSIYIFSRLFKNIECNGFNIIIILTQMGKVKKYIISMFFVACGWRETL
jgi:hypothetical protein